MDDFSNARDAFGWPAGAWDVPGSMRLAAAAWLLVAAQAMGAGYEADPAFNGGLAVEDRFAGVSNTNNYLGRRIVRLGDGTFVVAGVVPAAFQSAGQNVGLVRYGADGSRLSWPNPPAPYISFFDRYITYPNATSAAYAELTELKAAGGYLVILATRTVSAGNRDVDLIVFGEGGAFVGAFPAFATFFDEIAVGLTPYADAAAGSPIRLVAVARYVNSGRSIVTAKRFVVAANGSLSVDNAFGPFGNGANDYFIPNAGCDAGVSCSAVAGATSAVRTATAAPTIYVGGAASSTGATPGRARTFVMAIDGASGLLAPSFGRIATGIYVENDLLVGFDALSADGSFTGPATTDVVYVTARQPSTLGAPLGTLVAKYLAQGGFAPPNDGTVIDQDWGSNGTLGLPALCFAQPCAAPNANAFVLRSVLADTRLVLVGLIQPQGGGSVTETLLSVVDPATGALRSHQTLPGSRAGGTAWGGGALYDAAPLPDGTIVATGILIDPPSAFARLYGTRGYRPQPDALFGDGFE